MRALGGKLLLAAWDEGLYEHDLARALILLSFALPERERRSLAQLTIRQRNALLLQLHELTFGPLLTGLGTCSNCKGRFEFTLSAEGLRNAVADESADMAEWLENGVSYRMRATNTDDLLALCDLPDLLEAQRALVARCLDADGRAGAALLDRPGVGEVFESLHAAAELRFAIECCECAAAQTLDLDIARFLWLEVRSAAQLLLRDIRDLASAFGWSEAAIARMSAQRRSAYLQLANA